MPSRCSIYAHVIEGGPFCDCGALVSTPPEDGAQTIAIRPKALLELLRETSEEYRQWLASPEEVNHA